MPLSLYSEPYSATGNIGENFLKLLGAPATDPLQTGIREALQNIADAALPGRGPEIWIRLRRLAPEQLNSLRIEVLADLPQQEKSRQQLGNFLARNRPLVLEICDFNAVGLGGPVRADMVPDGNTRTDFIDFMMNVGSPRDVPGGGGTYGFGKAALYRLSRSTTILVDTLPANGDPPGRRLMACHLGASFYAMENGTRRRYTGRHWWGLIHGDPAPRVEPLVGAEAERLAAALGFPAREGGRTGTSIMILDFDLRAVTNSADEERDAGDSPDLLSVGNRIVEAVLWNFWPRMMQSTPEDRRFNVRVEVDGKSLEIPEPEQFPPLDLFCRAMEYVRECDPNHSEVIRSLRPARELGRLAIARGCRAPRTPVVRENSLFPEKAHHIALMRPVELVVRYLDGTPLPDESVEWAGVFRVVEDAEVERAFAESEPPAHDDWNPANLLKGPHKTFVNVALREVKRKAYEVGRVNPPEPGLGAQRLPLAEAADLMGLALSRSQGDGPDGPPAPDPGRGGQGPRRKPKVSTPVFINLEELDGNIVAVFAVHFNIAPGMQNTKLVVQPAIILDGESRVPGPEDILEQPRVAGFRINGRIQPAPEPMLDLNGVSSPVEVLVAMPAECAVSLKAWLAEEGENG